ncbi:MAG TPA: ABC transporter substrate-binding protein [Rhodocyclaceae bacterium]|nr:ABC transporter substrate-binding protein [Rhodocyclaceae bacterium]
MLGLCLVAGTGVVAQQQEKLPDVLVRNVTERVLDTLRRDKDIQNGNNERLMRLVEVEILPHFNFTKMTQLAVGRDWRQASVAQQRQLSDEFRVLLVRTYSNALLGYKDQRIEVKPLRLAQGETDVTVRTQIMQPGARPIPLDYSLEKSAGGWKVYDVVVAGVSLVTNYRETFAAEVRQGGIDGLIRSLQNKNRANVAAGGAK